MPSKKRRADGTLRPTVLRARRKRQRRRREQRLAAMSPEERQALEDARAEWLANFPPGARADFFKITRYSETIWLRAFSRELGLPQEEAAPLLAKTADERGWPKLCTRDGMCVGIAPFHPYKRKKRKTVSVQAD